MKKKLLTGFAIAILLLGVAACSHRDGIKYEPPVFSGIREASATAIGNEEVIYPIAFGISITDSIATLIGNLDDMEINNFNRFTGELVSQYVHQGQGPAEVVSLASYIPDSTEFKVLDRMTDLWKTYDKDGRFTEAVNLNEMIGEKPLWIKKLAPKKYIIGCCTAGNCNAMAIWDTERLGTIYTKTPFDENENTENEDNGNVNYYDAPPTLKDLYGRSAMTVSPDGKRMFTGTSVGVIVEIFDIKDMEISNRLTKFMYPFEISSEDGWVGFKENYVKGFTSLISTDQLVFGALQESSENNAPTDITVWDWNGNPVRRYKTDYLIYCMAFSPDNPDELYAMATKDGGEVQLIKLHCPGLQDS